MTSDKEPVYPEMGKDELYHENVLDQPPVEFFEATEAGKKKVMEYIESNRPFTLYTRTALALWLRGELKLAKRRPHLMTRGQEVSFKLRLAFAVQAYRAEREACGQKRGTAEDTRNQISKHFGIPVNVLEAKLRRGRTSETSMKLTPKSLRNLVLEMYEDWWISRNKSPKT